MEEPNDPSRSPLCQQKIEKAGTFLKQRANAREKEGRDKRASYSTKQRTSLSDLLTKETSLLQIQSPRTNQITKLFCTGVKDQK